MTFENFLVRAICGVDLLWQHWQWCSLKTRRVFILFLISIGIFVLNPTLDLRISGYFYDQQQGFYLAAQPWVQGMYVVFAKIYIVYLLLLLVLLCLPWLRRRLIKQMNFNKQHLWFLLIVLFVGPGLVVNTGLKNNSTGRARPDQVIQFGGVKQFSMPFKVANQCRTNCSFVSGHASAGFVLMALAWVLQRRYWLWVGIGLGLLVGFGRMLQGGHFFSDIVFSFWATYFSIEIIARMYRFSLSNPAKKTPQAVLFAAA